MNIERLISIDEKDDDMNHVFSLLNTFVYSIEDYICSNYKSNATFEKLTGGRIHLIISGKQANIALSICDYAISLTKEIVGFRQYQSIASVKLQFGLDFGKYVDFLFSDDGTDYEEYTSIGSVANYACKLQVHANANEVLISSDVFSLLNDTIKSEFVLIDTDRQTVLNKYNQNQLVYSKLLLPKQGIGLFNSYIDRARTYSANHALKSMNTIRPNVLNFSNWSINNNAKFDALIVFADVRGFTKKFNSNDSNLSELSEKTKRILSSMYNTCQNEEGVHIQFQGDREFVFFKESEFDKAVIYALKTVGSIKNIGECWKK